MKPPKINDQSLNRLCGIYFSLLNVVVCLFVLLGDFLAIKITHKKTRIIIKKNKCKQPLCRHRYLFFQMTF